MATTSSNENEGEPEGEERLGSASLQLSDMESNNHEQNSSRQANSAELPRVDANDLEHDEGPRPPQYDGGNEPDEWERGMLATYSWLTSQIPETTQVEIPQLPFTHTQASRLVGKAYEMEQKARILHTWAHRQLSNAKKNVQYSARRVEAAETQVEKIVKLIERDRYRRVVQYEPRGVPIMPYVVEQNGDICTMSMNGWDPISVLFALNLDRNDN